MVGEKNTISQGLTKATELPAVSGLIVFFCYSDSAEGSMDTTPMPV